MDIRTYDSPTDDVERIFQIHGVRAICFGHTHRPWGRWRGGRFRGNSGSWAPGFRDVACTRPVLDGRPLLFLLSCDGALSGGLAWWRGGCLVPDSGEAFAVPAQADTLRTGDEATVALALREGHSQTSAIFRV
jgi:hypothetical protein